MHREEVIDGQTFSNWDPYKNEPMTASTRRELVRHVPLQPRPALLRGRTRPPALVAEHGLRLGHRRRPRPEADGLVLTPAWRRRTFKTEIDKLWTSGDPQPRSAREISHVSPLQMTGLRDDRQRRLLFEPHLVKSIEEPRRKASCRSLRPYTPKPRARSASTTSSRSSRGALRRDPRELRTSQHVFGSLRPDRRQDRHRREVRQAPRLRRSSRPVVVRLRPLRQARDRGLRADRERRPRRSRPRWSRSRCSRSTSTSSQAATPP